MVFFNYNKKKKKKKKMTSQNDVVLTHLMAVDNWGLTEYRINNNWKLEDWNDKTESLRTEMKKTES